MGLVLSLFFSLPLLLAKGLNTTFVTSDEDKMCAPPQHALNIKDQGNQMKHLAGFSRESSNEIFKSHIACHQAIENTLTSPSGRHTVPPFYERNLRGVFFRNSKKSDKQIYFLNENSIYTIDVTNPHLLASLTPELNGQYISIGKAEGNGGSNISLSSKVIDNSYSYADLKKSNASTSDALSDSRNYIKQSFRDIVSFTKEKLPGVPEEDVEKYLQNTKTAFCICRNVKLDNDKDDAELLELMQNAKQPIEKLFNAPGALAECIQANSV